LPELKGGIHNLFDVLSEIYGARFSMLRVSAESGEGLEQLRQAVFELLDVIRVYTKAPGKKLERTAPYLLKRAARLMDLAAHVHQDFLAQLKYARLWGHGRVEGQMVNRDHVLEDRDLVELHR
jgi:ribosome-interacting GTPase 1